MTSDPDQAPPMMKIGEVATRSELSLRSLRHWEDVGLLRPSGRTEGGFRLYTEADLEKILVIRRMKPLGFTLDQMSIAMRDLETLREPMGDPGETEAAQVRLRLLQADTRERRAALDRQVTMADEFIGLLDGQLSPSDRTARPG